MRTSNLLLATLKEVPADAEIISHQLMLRAGLVRRLAAGMYTWLPLGMRSLRKVEAIVRQEMNRADAQEVLMPAVHPAELWQETGRWQKYGPELLRFTDRHQREFCFGPTHEEVITDVVRREIRSYKQLPVNFYQIQTKFRDEIRPRFGVMRAREFIMKDAYSFDIDHAGLERSYERMREAYENIFTRLQLDFRMVAADAGSIGGSRTHEFHVLAESGEDAIAFNDDGSYASNVELVAAAAPSGARPAPGEPLTTVATPEAHTIEAVSELLDLPVQRCLKTLFLSGVEGPVAVVLRGDHQLNVIKAAAIPGIAEPLTFAGKDEIAAAAGAGAGSVGPVGLSVPVYADFSAAHVADFVCGANRDGYHYRGVNWGRDLPEATGMDLRNIVQGEPCPTGNGTLAIKRGIEVGHIFQLGREYSEAMNAVCLDEGGRAQTLAMGCYGIGITRVVAAAIEQNHDEKGIIWPDAIAPFNVALLPMNMHKSQRLRDAVEGLYRQLTDAGFDVLLDDRKARPGVMFAEMELIGIPHRVVLGEKGLDSGEFEYKARRDAQSIQVPLSEAVTFLRERVAS